MRDAVRCSDDHGMERLRVRVIGAGIGGLAAAVLLHRAGFEVVVHERDRQEASRPQGGGVAIDGALGRRVIDRMGLGAAFARIAHPEAAGSRLVDAAGRVLSSRPSDPAGEDAEVDRPLLRELLLGALPADAVRWGRALVGIRETADGVEVRSADGSVVVADLVIGADGAWSRVRAHLSGAMPVHSGITFLDRRFDDVERRHPVVAEAIGVGTLFALGPDAGFIAQRLGDHARVYVAFRAPLERTEGQDAEEVRTALLPTFAAWRPEYRAFLTEGAAPGKVRPVFELPIGHRWRHRPAVTLVGDAAHLQSPFCALGSNGALLDAADLVDALVTHDDVATGLQAYERRMWPRAEANAAAAAGTLRDAFGPRGPEWYLRSRAIRSCRPEPVPDAPRQQEPVGA